MIKYNLKKILLEEDDIDIVDTTFMDKWDEVPEWADPDGDPGPKWEEYMDDLYNHVKDRVISHAKYNPDELTGLPSIATYIDKTYKNPSYHHTYKTDLINNTSEATFWADEYMDSIDISKLSSDDHIENTRAEPWTKDFNRFLRYMEFEYQGPRFTPLPGFPEGQSS